MRQMLGIGLGLQGVFAHVHEGMHLTLFGQVPDVGHLEAHVVGDRKSTRLNSSH